MKLKKSMALAKSFVCLALIFTVLLCSIPATGQDLVPISDITGGSSVFVFRGGSRSALKKFVARRSTRTRSQRIETAKRVSKQYTTLAKITPRRIRTTAVNPNDPRLKIKTMPREEATKLFAGVGEYHLDRDDYTSAIEYFRESLDLDSKNMIAITGLSEALSLKGNEELVKDNFPVSRTFFEEALKYNPKNAPAYFGLAEVFTELGQNTEATANFEKALETDAALTEIYTPLGILYYQQGEIAKADSFLTKAVAASPNDPQTQYFLGLVRFSQNRNEEALTAFKKSTSTDATNAEAFYYSGETLARLNRFSEAVVEFTQATVLKPAYFEAWFGLGSAQYQLRNFPAAIEAYKKATKLKNDNYEAYNNLGDAYRDAGSFNEAEANYGLAALFIQRKAGFDKEDAADMHSKAAFSLAKQCELNRARNIPCRWDVAVKALENASALSNSALDAANLGWAYYNAARADIANGRADTARPKLEKAKLNLQKVAASNSKFVAGPLLNLGMALTDLGDFPGAVEALNQVVKREPKWAFAINELGIAYRKQKNYKEAAAQFKKAIDKDGKFAAAIYNLGEAEFQAGNIGEAKKAWDKLKKMGEQGLAAKLDIVTNGTLRG